MSYNYRHNRETVGFIVSLRVNSSLCDEPSVAELRYTIATRHSVRRRVAVRTRAIMDFDLGSAPLNADSSVVHIMLENKGEVSTEWYTHTHTLFYSISLYRIYSAKYWRTNKIILVRTIKYLASAN